MGEFVGSLPLADEEQSEGAHASGMDSFRAMLRDTLSLASEVHLHACRLLHHIFTLRSNKIIRDHAHTLRPIMG